MNDNSINEKCAEQLNANKKVIAALQTELFAEDDKFKQHVIDAEAKLEDIKVTLHYPSNFNRS